MVSVLPPEGGNPRLRLKLLEAAYCFRGQQLRLLLQHAQQRRQHLQAQRHLSVHLRQRPAHHAMKQPSPPAGHCRTTTGVAWDSIVSQLRSLRERYTA